jgi:hypothetical protein
MDRKQFQINGYVSLFGNSREALFIYSKFGDIRGCDGRGSKLSSLNTKLVNKIISGNQLLSGPNYVLRRRGNSESTDSGSRLTEALVNQREFTSWLDKHNFGDMVSLQNLIVSGLILDSSTFNELSKPVYSYIKSNASLLALNEYENFSNNLKMYLTFPVASFTFLGFLQLLMTPMKITFGLVGFIKHNKG